MVVTTLPTSKIRHAGGGEEKENRDKIQEVNITGSRSSKTSKPRLNKTLLPENNLL